VDLIRLLTPVTKLPEVELLAAGLGAHEVRPESQSAFVSWRLDLYLFVTPRGNAPVVIPRHRCKCSIQPSEASGYSLPLGQFVLGSDTPGNVATKSAVTVTTPGVVTISGYYDQKSYTLPFKSQTVRVVGKARPIGADGSIDLDCELTGTIEEPKRPYVRMWGFGPFTSF
jgi:hypothetical protein